MVGAGGRIKVKENNVDSKEGKDPGDQSVVPTIFVVIENTKNKIFN